MSTKKSFQPLKVRDTLHCNLNIYIIVLKVVRVIQMCAKYYTFDSSKCNILRVKASVFRVLFIGNR